MNFIPMSVRFLSVLFFLASSFNLLASEVKTFTELPFEIKTTTSGVWGKKGFVSNVEVFENKTLAYGRYNESSISAYVLLPSLFKKDGDIVWVAFYHLEDGLAPTKITLLCFNEGSLYINSVSISYINGVARLSDIVIAPTLNEASTLLILQQAINEMFTTAL